LLRLSGAGAQALAELRMGPIRSPAAAVLARRLTDSGLAHPVPPVDGSADLTVVVPAYNRPELLAECLSALGCRYPVIVVDDASSDPAAIAAVAAARGAQLVRRERNEGPAAARNTGVAAVVTGLVAFVDSDCIPDPAVLGRLADHLADPAVVVAAPRITAAGAPGRIGSYVAARSALDQGAAPALVAPGTRVAYVPATTLVARRTAVEALRFDPALQVGEDVDLVWRLCAAGHRVRYDPILRVAHTEPATWLALLDRRFRYGTSAAALTRRHPGALHHLVVEPWTAGAVVALVARRPGIAAGLLVGGWTGELRRRRGLPVPTGDAAVAVATAIARTWRAAGTYATQFAAPVLVAYAARSIRRGRGPWTIASLVLAEPLTSWWTTRDRAADPLTHVVAHLAEDVAYGAGVLTGCVRDRSVLPLLPRLRRLKPASRS
jgi:mycofactocin system glycosyltransferase